MKSTKFLTAVALISSIVSIANADTANVLGSSIVNRAYCQISADSYDVFYFKSDGKFYTENEMLSREEAALKLGITSWSFNKETSEITAKFSSPSTGRQELKLKVISADEIQYKGKSLTPSACNK